MGAGLAAQRGWPQGEEPNLESPHSTEDTASGDTSSSPRHSLGVFDRATREETQPLEDGEGWAHYNSTSSLTSLVPVKRHQSMETEEGTSESLLHNQQGNVQNGQWGGDVVGEDEDLRESRAPSIAYDLGALHTEEEVRITRCCAALVRKKQGDIVGRCGGGRGARRKLCVR